MPASLTARSTNEERPSRIRVDTPAPAVLLAHGFGGSKADTDEQARDYPEGRYELALQTAAESGDQAELNRLFARRSSLDTIRIGL